MAGPKKLTKEQVMEMTGMSAESFDKSMAKAKAPSTNNFDQTQRNDDLSPTQKSRTGVSASFADAASGQAPAQPSANANLTLGEALKNSGTENSALNNRWKDQEQKAGLNGP